MKIYKMILNDQRCPNKAGGMKKFEEFKSLCTSCKIANMMMMLKTKKQKTKIRNPSTTLGE
jgi:hypothetical protein